MELARDRAGSGVFGERLRRLAGLTELDEAEAEAEDEAVDILHLVWTGAGAGVEICTRCKVG